ncbi:MAG: substrate-binding domain-containing protein [Arenimonas sp.]
MNHQKYFWTILLWLLVVCDSAMAQDVIRINGSNTLGNRMVPILAVGWMKKFGYGQITQSRESAGSIKIGAKRDNESITLEIKGNGSGAGFQDLVNGNAEIAMLSRSLSAKEIDDGWQLGSLNSPDQEHVLALQAITAIVNSANQLPGLDALQLSKIISGEITDWRQVGGKPGAIHLHIARQNTGLAEMQSTILNVRSVSGDARRHADSKIIQAAVAADANAIGITEFSVKPGAFRTLPVRVANRYIPADLLHIKTEDYPLMRRLYFYTGQIVTALGRGFVTYAESEEAQRLLASHGYLSLAPMAIIEDDKENFPKEYAQWVEGASRVSLSFRFGNAFSIFDSRGAQDIVRLKDFMQRPENRNRKVILIGHAEKQSSIYQSNSISNEYADLVATSLMEIGINPMRVRGVGYSLPLTLANNAVYRNRRVEIWLR